MHLLIPAHSQAPTNFPCCVKQTESVYPFMVNTDRSHAHKGIMQNTLRQNHGLKVQCSLAGLECKAVKQLKGKHYNACLYYYECVCYRSGQTVT